MDTQRQPSPVLTRSTAFDHKERIVLLQRAAQLAALGEKRALADLLAALNAAARNGTLVSV
jgi:hypothetical protein